MQTIKRSYEVSILNQKFIIKSEADERYVQKVADYVGKKMHDIMAHMKSVSSLRVAILAALNLADDYFKIKEKRKDGHLGAQKKIKELISQIESKIA